MKEEDIPDYEEIDGGELEKMSFTEKEILDIMNRTSEEFGEPDSEEEKPKTTKDNAEGAKKIAAIGRIMEQKRIIKEQEEKKRELEEKEKGDLNEER